MSPPISHYDIAELAPFKNALATGSRLVWLYEIEVPTGSPPTRYRFCAQIEEVTFRGNIYSPFPITHERMKEGADGDLPTLALTVSNVSREIGGTLESYNGLIGQRVKIMLVLMTENQETSPQDPLNAILEWDFKITSMAATAEAASAQLGDISLYNVFMPSSRIAKRYCRFQYKDAACGYAGAFPTCDKSLDGPNGCQAHSSDSTAHPDRFGGFPGVPIKKAGGLL
jgi:lambda family phage minor tail protein L